MPHDPTSVGPNFTPTTCWCCGRHATGIGIGQPSRGEPKWLCEFCIPLIAHIRAVKRFDVYEQRAVTYAIDNVGPLVEKFGVDLSEWSEEQRTEFATEIILGFGHSIREQVRMQEVPF